VLLPRRLLSAGLLAVLVAGCGWGAPPARPRAELTAAPGATSSSESPPTPQARSFTLVATGDVLLHEPLWEQAQRDAAVTGQGPLDFGPQLAALRPLVETADLAVCHLETPMAPASGPYQGYPMFSGPPQILPALAGIGYDACTTASNHTFDQGGDGVARTLDALDAAGLAHAGSARSPEEASRTTIVDVRAPAGPVRVALLSYTYGFNGVPYPNGESWRANLLDEERILADAGAARQQGAEAIVVALHWGTEFDQAPNEDQLAIGPRLLASPDVDLVLGHHAHVVQPIEHVAGEWIVYGLGNLVAAHATPGEPLREGLLVRFGFVEQPDGRFAVAAAGYAPLLVSDPFPARVLDVAAALRAADESVASLERLQEAWDRTTSVVSSRAAPAAGLVPLSTP
jgi:poly-gamma-glutamate capsule biosynthesis protein CapA/YwtB (metallophosphatase superfamily)